MAVSFESITCTSDSNYIDPTVGGNGVNFAIIDGDTIRITNTRTISSETESGYKGEICFDSHYVYFCVDTNKWRRLPLQGF